MNLFKKLAFLTTMLCASAHSNEILNTEKVVLSCKVLVESGEYTEENGKLFIKPSVIQDICKKMTAFQDFNAWQMLDFHVFIYVECPNCHAAHLIEYNCPNCQEKPRVS